VGDPSTIDMKRSRTVLAVRQATLRLSLRASFLERREKWRTPLLLLCCQLATHITLIRRRCWPPAWVSAHSSLFSCLRLLDHRFRLSCEAPIARREPQIKRGQTGRFLAFLFEETSRLSPSFCPEFLSPSFRVFRSMLNDKPALYYPLKWPTRPRTR